LSGLNVLIHRYNMRKRFISKLDYHERQWFFKAAILMIIADKSVAEEEVEELKQTVQQMAGPDYQGVADILKSSFMTTPLKPLKNIKYDKALIIIIELARIAALDSKVVLEESTLLDEILSLMDFKKDAVDVVVKWAKRLALVNKEEENRKNELKQFYKQ